MIRNIAEWILKEDIEIWKKQAVIEQAREIARQLEVIMEFQAKALERETTFAQNLAEKDEIIETLKAAKDSAVEQAQQHSNTINDLKTTYQSMSRQHGELVKANKDLSKRLYEEQSSHAQTCRQVKEDVPAKAVPVQEVPTSSHSHGPQQDKSAHRKAHKNR
jgi:glutamine synthetase type III